MPHLSPPGAPHPPLPQLQKPARANTKPVEPEKLMAWKCTGVIDPWFSVGLSLSSYSSVLSLKQNRQADMGHQNDELAVVDSILEGRWGGRVEVGGPVG